jgi:uncharacterized protein YndB with AHSA1/START domain
MVRTLMWMAILVNLTTSIASPVRAEVKDSSPAGFTIENSALVPVDAAVAWRVLIDQVDSWWPKDHTWWGKASKLTLDARAGGCFCEVDGERQARHLEVVFADPGKLLRLSGGLGPMQGMGLNGVLEWRFAPAGEGTRITLWYRAGGYTPDDLTKFAPVVDRVQGVQLGALAARLREHPGKGTPGP